VALNVYVVPEILGTVRRSQESSTCSIDGHQLGFSSICAGLNGRERFTKIISFWRADFSFIMSAAGRTRDEQHE